MNLVVADANIFVYMYRCNLLEKILKNKQVEIKISNAVYQELTATTRRIPREHPALRNIILDYVHNTKSDANIQVIYIEEIKDLYACKIYFSLDASGELDDGELESIPIALDLKATFVSNDEDAVNEANDIKSDLAMLFIDFCNNLHEFKIIDHQDFCIVKEFIDNYG